MSTQENPEKPLILYQWDTDIGKFTALAESVEAARILIMAELSEKDVARGELSEAISVDPEEILQKPHAILAWH